MSLPGGGFVVVVFVAEKGKELVCDPDREGVNKQRAGLANLLSITHSLSLVLLIN